MAIYSCMNCVAPKRHPGCHDRCAEYLKEKTQHDALKEAEYKRKQIEYGLIARHTAIKFHQRKG